MNIPYQKEMDFFLSVMEKMRLPVHLLHPEDAIEKVDAGLRKLLRMQEDYEALKNMSLQWNMPRTIYQVMDQFLCHYIYFQLPFMNPVTALVIGPYMVEDLTQEDVLERIEFLKLPMASAAQLSDYYASLPVYADASAVMAMIYAFGEVLWKNGNAFDVVDVNYEQSLPQQSGEIQEMPAEQADILLQMKQLEERYAYEDLLMDTVAKGLVNKAEIMMSSVSGLNYQQRLSDPLRNMKNYCIICNTLLRKAAQQGGVHPIHLDKTSDAFARNIENSPSTDACSRLIGEMIRTYCHMVRNHSISHCTGIIQKTITYMESNVSGDLSLNTLAGLMNVSPGYLSSLFHQNMGKTLVEYVTALRMKTARQMMANTQLQVQTVAQLAGFADPNYFGKVFRRYYGVTPQQYRKNHRSMGTKEG